MNRFMFVVLSLILVGCSPSSTGIIRPELAFSIGPEAGLSAPRDLTVDESGGVFVFDYDDYRIHRFTPEGALDVTFGGSQEVAGDFQHLMAVAVSGDSLIALDAGSVSVFDLTGERRSRRSFSDTIVCDLPRIHSSGAWVGDLIVDETAESTLTLRRTDGSERAKVAGYPLSDFFPGVEPGGFFFVRRTQAPAYHYDFLPDGRLVWAASDRVEILLREGLVDASVYVADDSPLPFPPDSIQLLREQQANQGPPLFMNVPEHYQLIQHLLVDEDGHVWIYVLGQTRTGFLHLTDEGREIGFYPVEAEFGVPSSRVTAANGNLYFLVWEESEARIFVADRP